MSLAGGRVLGISLRFLCAWGIGIDEAATQGYLTLCLGLLADRKVLSGFDKAATLLACLQISIDVGCDTRTML